MHSPYLPEVSCVIHIFTLYKIQKRKRIIDFYKSGKLDINSVIERKYSLDKINEAYEDLENGKDGRGIIDFTI